MTRSITERMADYLLARSGQVSLLLVIMLAIAFSALPHLRTESGMQVFFAPDDPLQGIIDEVNEHFVTDDLIFVAYEESDVLSHQSLSHVRQLSDRLAQLETHDGEPLFEDVTSLSTIRIATGQGDTFRSIPLVPDPIPTNARDLALIAQRARANPVIADGMMSANGRASMVILRFGGQADDTWRADAVEKTRAAVETLAPETGRYFVFGEAVTWADTAAYQERDLQRFIPIVYAIIIVVLFLFVRTIGGVLLSLVTVTLGLITSMASLVLTGGSLNNCSVMLPPLVMVLGVATMIHFLAELGRHLDAGADAPRQTLASLLRPVFMASLTTSVGFAALALSTLPAVRSFGIAAAVAVIVLFVLATAVVSLAWRFGHPRLWISHRGLALSSVMQGFLTGLGRFLIRHRRATLMGGIATTIFFAVGITRITVDQNPLAFFSEQTAIRKAHTFMDEALGGSAVVVVSVRSDKPQRFFDPAELERLVALQAYLEDDLGAHAAMSIVDFLKTMHRALLHDDPEAYRLPQTREQVAQLLLINDDTRVEEYMDAQGSWVRVVARHDVHSSRKLKTMYERLDATLATLFPATEGYQAHATGQSRLWSTVFLGLIRSQGLSLAASALFIFGIIFALFRSLRTGLLSIPCNAFPIFAVLGVMGWSGIELDAATVMISTVALGIAVDDTIHFLQHYRQRLASGDDVQSAVLETISTKGPAIIGTSVVICLGFSVFWSSLFLATRNFGVLTSLSMFAAIVGDLILLPVIILTTGTRLGVPSVATVPGASAASVDRAA